jgi:Spy/CpxP family protein refolding chaperone
MKRSFLAALALLTLALPAAAQQRMGGPPQSGTGIFTGITLTPAQQKQVDSLYAANQPMRDKMRAQMQSGQRPDSAQMASMRDMRQKAAASYRGILNPDQQKVFDKNLADMQERMRSMAPAGAGQGGPPNQ